VATGIALQVNAQRSAVDHLLEERFEATGRRAALEIQNQLAQAQVITTGLGDSLNDDDLKNPDKLQKSLSKLPLVDARVLRTLSVMDLGGHNIAWVPESNRPPANVSFAWRDYFKKVVSTDKPYIEGPFLSSVIHTPVVVIGAPIHDRQRRVVGVAASAIEVSTSYAFRHLNHAVPGDDAYFIVVSADGTIVAHPDINLVGKPLTALGFAADAIGRALTLGETSARATGSDGKRYVFSFQSIRGPREPWLLAAVQSEESLLEPMESELRKGVLVAAAVSLGGAAILITLIVFMLAPLRRVQARLQSLSDSAKSDATAHDNFALEPEAFHDSISKLSAAKNSAEQERLTSCSLLQAALYSVRDGVIAVNTEGTIKTMNSAASSLTGWRMGDAENRKLTDVYAPTDEASGEIAPCPLDAVIARRMPHAREGLKLTSRSGNQTAVKENVTPVLLPDGSVCGLVVVFRDPGREDSVRRAAMSACGIQGVEMLGGALENVIEEAQRQNTRNGLVVVEMGSGGAERLTDDELKTVWRGLNIGCSAVLRSGDTVFRWGKRTAMAVVVDIDLAEVALLAGQLLTSASDAANGLLEPPCTAKLTVGVVTFDRDAETPAALVRLAEESMAFARSYPGTMSIYPGSAGIDMVRELHELLRL
jgi:PAS domain S-box-containing protein